MSRILFFGFSGGYSVQSNKRMAYKLIANLEIFCLPSRKIPHAAPVCGSFSPAVRTFPAVKKQERRAGFDTAPDDPTQVLTIMVTLQTVDGETLTVTGRGTPPRAITNRSGDPSGTIHADAGVPARFRWDGRRKKTGLPHDTEPRFDC